MRISKAEKLLVGLVFLTIVFVVFLVIFRSNQAGQEVNEDNKPLVLTTILPTKQIIQEIAGNTVTVQVLLKSGFNPATSDLTTNDLKLIRQAQLYFQVGFVDFERNNLDKIQELNPELKIINISKNCSLQDFNGVVVDGSNLAEIDPHTWLAPLMVKQQAQVIAQALVKQYPENARLYQKNLEVLVDKLENIDTQLRTAFEPIRGKTMLVYHPAFGYLAREYGFKQEYIQFDGKDPSINDLQKIIDRAKAEKVKVIFVQKQFSTDSAHSIAENIHGVVMQVDPLAENYLESITKLSTAIIEGLK